MEERRKQQPVEKEFKVLRNWREVRVEVLLKR